MKTEHDLFIPPILLKCIKGAVKKRPIRDPQEAGAF